MQIPSKNQMLSVFFRFPRRGDSNKHPHDMFLNKDKKKMSLNHPRYFCLSGGMTESAEKKNISKTVAYEVK